MDRKICIRAFLLAMVVATFLASYVGCAKRSPHHAIVILMDAARPDRFSCFGYEKQTTPEMDHLANNGAVFLDCFTQGANTPRALPCLIYSRYFAPSIFPMSHFIPLSSPSELFQRIDDECLSFPKAMERKGFLTAAISAHEWLTTQTKFAGEFMEMYDLQTILEFEKKYAYPRANRVIDFSIGWIEKNRKKDFLLYIHIMDTHFPHFFEEEAKFFFGADSYDANRFAPSGEPRDIRGEFTESDVRYLDSLYDGSLRYTDREVGRLVKYLKDSGQIEDTLLVITADHGEFLLEREGVFGHGSNWYDPIAKIPLILHYPRKINPRRETTFSELVDLGPTLLKLMDVDLPEGKMPDGCDLMAVIEGFQPPKNVAYFHGGIRTKQFKCLFQSPVSMSLSEKPPETSSFIGELYDLVKDPKEKENLFQSEPGIAMELFGLYRQKMVPKYARHLSAQTHEQPAIPFAISATHFSSDLKIAQAVHEENPEKLLRMEAPDGWLQRNSWDFSWKFAKPSAKPLHVKFPVPDGKYFLLADINGSCILEVNGGEKILKSNSFVNHIRWNFDLVEFGTIEIQKEMFSAVIYPQPNEFWFAIRALAFEPIIYGERRTIKDEDQERLERLKALGYLK